MGLWIKRLHQYEIPQKVSSFVSERAKPRVIQVKGNKPVIMDVVQGCVNNIEKS